MFRLKDLISRIEVAVILWRLRRRGSDLLSAPNDTSDQAVQVVHHREYRPAGVMNGAPDGNNFDGERSSSGAAHDAPGA
jgi:hypothetical protein